MKDINDILNESLLDDEDKIMDDGIKRILVNQFYDDVKLGGHSSKDILGRPLYEGDMVICKYSGYCVLGMIEKIKGDKCAVYIGGPIKNRTDSSEIPTRDVCKELIKITPEIASQIMGLK
jgi:hypothetical protein